MNLQTNLSGKISAQVVNHAGPPFSGLPHQNGNPVTGQMLNPSMQGGLPPMDPDRRYMQQKILEFLMQRRQQSPEQPSNKIIDLVKKLESCLFKNARSKEEYSDLATLGNRLQFLIKSLPQVNQIQPFQHANSSPSIGTMIPTPGLQQPGNSSLIRTSPLDSSLAANHSSNMIASSTVNSGSFMSPGNGSSGSVPGGSFSSSNGALASGYQQSSAFSMNAGGNNMVASVGVQKMTSQMIPTPGFNNFKDADLGSNNQSAVKSAIVSQSMQQMRHVGGQNSRILHNLSGPMGGGIRSTLQQQTKGLVSGPSNGGSGMMGNNMSMLNGPGSTEGYSTGTMYQNSSKSTHQHFERHRPMLQGDEYGIDAADASGSGDLYVPVSSVGSVMNNQYPSAGSMHFMPKTNSGLINNQSTVHSTQQNQLQHNSMKDRSRPAQLLSHPPGEQDVSSSHIQTSDQMQQSLHLQQYSAKLQHSTGNLSSGVQSDAASQSQWYSKSHDVSHVSERYPLDHNVHNEFHHRLTGKDVAQLNNLSSAESMVGESNASRSAEHPNRNNPVCQSNNLNCEKEYKNQQRWLLFLMHARRCPSPEGKCREPNCSTVQKLLKHMERCKESRCSHPRCHFSKRLLHHYSYICRNPSCPVCIPVKKYVHVNRLKALACSDINSGLPGLVSGSYKSHDAVGVAGRSTLKTSPSSAESPEDLQPSIKRMKIEQGSQSHVSESVSSIALVSAKSEPEPALDVVQHHEPHLTVKSEIVEAKMEDPGNLGQSTSDIVEMKKGNVDNTYVQKPEGDSVVPNTPGFGVKEANKIEEGIQQGKPEVMPMPSQGASKSGKPNIKGVSMTELFTPEQVRQHITGLRRWVGQSKAKAERNQALEHAMSENSCQLCAVEKLTFEPPPLYCTPCGARVKRNAMYYTIGSGEQRHYFCIPCYNESRGDTIVVDGTTIPKARMEKKKNDEETEEWWVQCDKCEAWQHQICALFNGRRNDGGQAEYTCPNCYIEEVERGERVPLPQSAVLGAKDLPRTILSDHLEQRLFAKLKQERQERARVQGKSYDEVPGADSLVVRVVSSVDKKLEVKPRFLEIFQEENYPTEFPYKSKVVLLFQKIEGVEVCLYGMYVQEFGSECQQPNHRRVYLSYLDSVKYFRPEVKAVTGEALRTFVYHEILIGYLEYCKHRGFTSCYIWACPPLKGEDYILYCHPEIQKTPKSDKLREWYLSMLRKAMKENIVVELTNLYDHFFVSTGECKAKVTASRLPYFDGDYWPGAAEDMIFQLQEEGDGRKQHKKGTMKKTITKRALKASGHTDLTGKASKDLMLMHKLGETISPMKEDFIMVHLQHSCTHCCILMVSGNCWVCRQCRNFQLCDKCYDAERRRDDRERHPINQKDKHSFYPVEINDVPDDTKDKDEILESEFFDTRQAFLSLCQGNHYQYDTLRRAKHSSMMVLYHLHNPTAPAFVATCNICHLDIESGQGWRCETCPEYDVCNACYQKDGGVDHPHKLTNNPSNDRDAQNTEARELRVVQLRKMLELLVHASQCRSPQCQYPNCRKVKGLFRHGMGCKVRAAGGCVLCKKMWYLLQLHARSCKESECTVPRCRDLKEHLRRLQQQADSRRRAAVMEMMRQRAAEVAGN